MQWGFLVPLQHTVCIQQCTHLSLSILPCSPQVVKMKGTEKVYALKILNKWEMLKRHQVSTRLIPRSLVSFPNHIQHWSHSQTSFIPRQSVLLSLWHWNQCSVWICTVHLIPNERDYLKWHTFAFLQHLTRTVPSNQLFLSSERNLIDSHACWETTVCTENSLRTITTCFNSYAVRMILTPSALESTGAHTCTPDNLMPTNSQCISHSQVNSYTRRMYILESSVLIVLTASFVLFALLVCRHGNRCDRGMPWYKQSPPLILLGEFLTT